mgnify:CR=1 FL=1
MHGVGWNGRAVDDGRRRAQRDAARAGRRRHDGEAWPAAGCASSRSATAISGSTSRRTPTSPRTLRAAIAKIKAAPEQPSFVLHTGDLTHLSKPSEFDTLQQVLSRAVAPGVLRARRARRARRRRQELSGAIRQGDARRRLAQLRPGRRALHRSRQRREPQSRRARDASATSSSSGSRRTSSA